MKYKIPIVFILCILGFYNLYAGNPTAVKQFINHKDWNFVENKGQLTASAIKYYGHQGGVYIYCESGMIEFVFTKTEKESDQISEATGSCVETQCLRLNHASATSSLPGDAFNASLQRKITTTHADLILLNSNASAQILASDQQEYYENYYTANTSEEGITNVHTYKTITYKEIYPHIDMVLHANEGGMKYEFVVYPGGKVSDIQMKWEGIEGIKKLKDSGIEYSLFPLEKGAGGLLGKMTESAPYSYQGMTNVRAGLAPAQSENISDETYGQLGTRKGHLRPDDPFGRAYNENAEIKIESQFIINNNIIGFTSAAYDKTQPLVIDPTLVWGTYFGGNNETPAVAVCADHFDNVYITGFTASDSGIASIGAYQTSFAGAWDVYIAKFSSSGSRLWSTYYGGNANDEGYGISVSVFGNIYVTGWTYSKHGIATSGAYQTSLLYQKSLPADSVNAFLAKFNSSGARLWGTYYGGGNGDYGQGVSTNDSDDVYITGYTHSPNGIATAGSYQASYGGNIDVFVAKFSGSGNLLWGTYFGGSGHDYGQRISTDTLGNVYIIGYTTSANGIATSGAYQVSNGGGAYTGYYDAFLAKFNTAGHLSWATYFGGSSNDYGYAVCSDNSGNVIITGSTYSSSNIATSGAHQTSLAGGVDAFLAKFSSSGKLNWATYYGGNLSNNGNDVSTDLLGNIYLTGGTNSPSGIATIGAYQTSIGAGNGYAFLSYFDNTGILSWGTYYGGNGGESSSALSIGANGDVYMVGSTGSSSGIATSGAYQTHYTGRNTYVNAFLAKFHFEYNDAGVDSIETPFKVSCAGIKPVKIQLKNYGDNTLNSVQIGWSINGIIQTPYIWNGTLLPDSVTSLKIGTYNFSSGYNINLKTWTSIPNGQSDMMTDNDTSNIIFSVIPLPQVNTGLTKTICEDSVITIGGAPVNGYSYSWTSDPSGFSSTISKPYVNPVKTTRYKLTVTDRTTGCSNSDSVVISVNPAPPISVGSDKTICFGDSAFIGDTASKTYNYNWTSNPAGFTSTLSNPNAKPKTNTSYLLVVTNPKTQCISFKYVKISVNPLPVANVGQPSYSICNGTHIKIGANAQPDIIYSWTSNPLGFTSTLSNPVVDPALYTVYDLTVSDSVTGCINKNFANISVSILKAPVANVGYNQSICKGTSAQIGYAALSGDTYSWTSNPTGFSSTIANPVITPKQTTSYSLTVTSAAGCTNFDSVTITVNQPPKANAGDTTYICGGTGTTVQLGDSAIGNYVYSWTSIPKGFTSSLSDPNVSPDSATAYYLKVTDPSTGCSGYDSVLIAASIKPNVAIGVHYDGGFEYQFTAINPNYPSGDYYWDLGDTSNKATDSVHGYQATHIFPKNGKYTVTLYVIGPPVCYIVDTFQVVINEQFSVNIRPNPFELKTDINYVLVNTGHVRISLVDEVGKQLGVLVDKQLNRGEYNTYFDATLWRTRPAMYFILFQLDDKLIVKKIIQIDGSY